ncbi:MAG TPA: T9SS type A sorting domain-containing protein, partial [Candidatus Cloacimonadota bacterium]|nr:T9SS type A sorting domain-containing protein [Candidatus Cloacimonadota bacterium]
AYPNPFSSEITIKTQGLPAIDSKLLIYNIRGQLLDTIELRDNTVNWTPRDMPSGIYILNLVGDGDILARKRISYIK